MRRLLWAFLALTLALPAQAGRVLVIKPSAKTGTEADNLIMKRLGMLEGVLKTFGVQYDVVPQMAVASCGTCPATNVSQGAIITGLVSYNTNGTLQRQYAGIIHLEFTPNATSSSRVAGYNPDTLTLARASGGVTTTWPAVPTLFMGPGNVAASGVYATTATCSTGVAGAVAGLSSTKADLAYHLVGQPEVWKAGVVTNGGQGISYFHAGGNGLTITSAGGITKSRIVYSTTASAVRDSGSYYCNDCDSLFTPGGGYTSSPASDTSVIWTRERYSGDTAPLIFALPIMANNGQNGGEATLVAMAVALMDSASRGAIIGQAPGWTTPKIGFVVSGAMTHSYSQSTYNGVASSFGWNIHGGIPGDSTYLKAGIDSLASLNVPVMVTVNVDSIDSYPNEKAWWSSRLPLAKFSPESRVYTDSMVAGVNRGETNASKYLFPDVFGIYRSRTLITAARYDSGGATLRGLVPTSTCADGDSTLSCLLYFMRARLDSVPEFKGRMSRAIQAPWFDYIPRNFTRNSMGSVDTFAVALIRSGFDTAINGTMHVYSAPSSSWGLATGGSPNVGQTTYSPGTWLVNPRVQQVKSASGRTIGKFKWLNMRHVDEDVLGNVFTIHDIAMEFWQGFFQTPWYPQDLPYWNHAMRTKLSVIEIRPADLGCTVAGSTVPLPARPGYYMIKYAVNQVRAINKLAGRTVISIDYPENIVPTP